MGSERGGFQEFRVLVMGVLAERRNGFVDWDTFWSRVILPLSLHVSKLTNK